MPYKDLRQFISKLDAQRELCRIEEEVDWDMEAAAMLRLCYEKGLPAPFFQKLRNYPAGYSIVGGILSNHKRIASSLGIEPAIHPKELMEEYIKRKKKLVKPVLVDTGPCKENVHTGGEIDLFEFPVPFIHRGDGGRYIGTWHVVICKDPDSDWVNWGMYRCMVHNKNTLGIFTEDVQHLTTLYRQKYEARSRPMEVAIAIGVEPISSICAATDIPYGVSEADVAGGIRGEPLELVQCETVDLSVPSTAEVVIEGEILPRERMDEGPFGEYTGYATFPKSPRPVIHVRAITHRNNPILTMTCEGIPVVDSHALVSLRRGSELLDAFRARGTPVTGVSIYPESAGILAVVSVRVPYANIADEISHVVWGSKAGQRIAYLIVVEDDIDVYDRQQVLHAVVTKCHPYRGIHKIERATGIPLIPWATTKEKLTGQAARVYFDCTWPKDWPASEIPARVSFKESYPSEIQEKALSKWKQHGYSG